MSSKVKDAAMNVDYNYPFYFHQFVSCSANILSVLFMYERVM